MSTTQFDSRRKPRQLPFPIFPNAAARFRNSNLAPATAEEPTSPTTPTSPAASASTSFSTGFFTPSAAAVAATPQVTLTASSAQAVVAEPTAAPAAAEMVGAEVQVEAQPATFPAAVDVTQAAPPLVTASAVASGPDTTVVAEQSAAVSTSPGGIAMGAIGMSLALMAHFFRHRTNTASRRRLLRQHHLPPL